MYRQAKQGGFGFLNDPRDPSMKYLRAIDIETPGCPPLTEAFEQTLAYDWLIDHAGEFGIRLSYPRGNSHGVSFEPWHWLFNEDPA